MPDRDKLQRFIFDQSDIRGEILTLEKSYGEVIARGNYPQAIKRLLGEFMAATGLLGATLKFDGVLTLQAQGDGPLSMIMADCTRHHNLRAIARFDPSYNFNTDESLAQLVGKGTLSLTIDPSNGERYQGIVLLEPENLASCLEDYFTRSEQIRTRIWLAADTGPDSPKAAGLLLQALPRQLETSAEENLRLWEHATQLANTITPEEQLILDHEEQLHRLFHQDQLRLFEAKPVQFSCSCSKERITQALFSLGEKELSSILDEAGLVAIDCQFCDQHYRFTRQDIQQLFDESPPVLH
ncbi:Hsp33 family molecular chaperone HslO [Porticoccus sp.]|uniref:Hsp33 family molecular chaperone HslO n=1 Tax=Porticoccus sp. TaxID=2024853 RepID=UPI003F6A2ED1